MSNVIGHFVFGVLKTPVFHLNAYSTLHRKTLTLTFCHLAGANCVISFMAFLNIIAMTSISKHKSCVFYLGRGFIKFFSFSVCFHTFRFKFLLLFLDKPYCLLIGEQMLLIFGTWYLPAFNDVEIFFRAGDFKSDSGLCQNFKFWLATRTSFCHTCGQVVASDGITF